METMVSASRWLRIPLQTSKILNSLLSGSFLINSSLSAPTKIEELTAGSDEKNTAQPPPGIEPRILRILVARSNHWATKPQRELRVNFSTLRVIVGRCVLVDSGNPGHLVVEKELTARNDPDKSEFTIEGI